jgi:hypothetical protein
MAIKRKCRKRVKKVGGFIPLLPLLGPLIAGLGSLAAGSAGIASAVNKAKADAKMLAEAQRHNQRMEGKGLKKRGKGLYLGPQKTGKGLKKKSQGKRARGKGLYLGPQKA